MENKDIRWIQRFNNYKKALEYLEDGIKESQEQGASDTVKAGVIQFFETVYELAWNTIKDFYEVQGETDIHGSRDAIRLAFNRGLIIDGESWMKMIGSRKLTVHTYHKDTAQKALEEIVDIYFNLFKLLETRLELERLRS
jgi:nucleotidyltransferase substrate binding protein (TIGR01987 family)